LKEKSLYYFHKKLKIKKTKKTFLVGFLGGFLGFFWVGFLMPTLAYLDPAFKVKADPDLALVPDPGFVFWKKFTAKKES
jgi:hypothetical protein